MMVIFVVVVVVVVFIGAVLGLIGEWRLQVIKSFITNNLYLLFLIRTFFYESHESQNRQNKLTICHIHQNQKYLIDKQKKQNIRVIL